MATTRRWFTICAGSILLWFFVFCVHRLALPDVVAVAADNENGSLCKFEAAFVLQSIENIALLAAAAAISAAVGLLVQSKIRVKP